MKRACIFFSLALLLLQSCDLVRDPASFQIGLTPTTMESIAGQKCVLLLTITDEGDGFDRGQYISVTARADGQVLACTPNPFLPKQAAEILYALDLAAVGKDVVVQILAERNGYKQEQRATIHVIAGSDQLAQTATGIRDRFIPWLAQNHPALNINTATVWDGTIVTPNILIVANYLFFSEEWEMGLTYHVMIPPNDWARIYLRRRYEDSKPTLGFEINSLTATEPPHVWTPPGKVMR